MSERVFDVKVLIFAKRVVEIVFFEWGQNEQTATCLVLGQNEEAEAVAALLKTRCRETDREPRDKKIYDIIILTELYDVHLLKNMTDSKTLVADAAMSKKVRYFDPSLPFRQVRVVSLSLA